MQALLEIGAHSPHNEVRLAAQKAVEPLQLKADILSSLLQIPSLGPQTPTPVSKRAKKGKEPSTPKPTPTPKIIQGISQSCCMHVQTSDTV